MHDLLNKRVSVYPVQGAALATNVVNFAGATGVIAVFNFGERVEVSRWGLIVDSASAPLTPGTGMVLTLKRYPIPGINTNAVTLSTLSLTANIAAGLGAYNDLSFPPVAQTGEDNSVRYVAPRDEGNNIFVVPEGQQLVIELTTAAQTQGKGQVWVETMFKGGFGGDMTALGFTKVTA